MVIFMKNKKVILNIGANPKSLLKLESKVLSIISNMFYGIHICVMLCNYCFLGKNYEDSFS